MYRFIGPDEYGSCQDFHDPGDCGMCCVPRGDAGVMPYDSGTEDIGVDERITAF